MAEKILLGHMTNKFDTLEYHPQPLKCSKQDSLTYLTIYLLSWYTT